ncbi:hypothetical protein [Robiginitalea sediminis]|uniref:hypothetical protein n=1 Tax=Robiginitalea sediminis TaxID=1982593 RepID=UPI000B4BC150|nr:hypothetical protein [Robiginitalea sediminis]
MLTNIEIEITPIEELIDALKEKIGEYFLQDATDDFIPPSIETDLSGLIDELKEDLYCLIEYPYVDKVYRDSFYNYYSSKHFTYQRDCIRVSLFSEEITHEEFLDSSKHSALDNKFLGYFVIRPTINSLFGRSIISPAAFEINHFHICLCRTDSLIYGVKLSVEGFPHSSQDGETIKCAETTIWALMEYFGNKYAEYKPALPAKIHSALERFSYQRQLPSNGLTMDQISFALKEFGFGTSIYSKGAYGDQIYNIIDSYVESGIPVIVGLQSGHIGHVIIAVGKKVDDKVDWTRVNKSTIQIKGKSIEYFETTNIEAKYVVQDDNHAPYRLINLSEPGEHYDEPECRSFEIDSIVVPLYPKIYLESVVAKQLVLNIVQDSIVGYEFKEGFVFRFFLASSRSFKAHIARLEKMQPVLKNSILLCKMPKFIWVGEFYPKESVEIHNDIADGIVVLDATEANQESIDALIFAGYPDRCISLNDNNFVTLNQIFQNYRYYSNLK